MCTGVHWMLAAACIQQVHTHANPQSKSHRRSWTEFCRPAHLLNFILAHAALEHCARQACWQSADLVMHQRQQRGHNHHKAWSSKRSNQKRHETSCSNPSLDTPKRLLHGHLQATGLKGPLGQASGTEICCAQATHHSRPADVAVPTCPPCITHPASTALASGTSGSCPGLWAAHPACSCPAVLP